MVGHHQIGGSLVWTNNWVLGYMGLGDVRGGVGFGDVYGLLGENVGGGGVGDKIWKEKMDRVEKKKWWPSKSHWERQNKKLGMDVQLLDLLWIKKKLELHLYPKKKKKRNFILENKRVSDLHIYILFPLNPKNLNNFSFNNNLPIVLKNV